MRSLTPLSFLESDPDPESEPLTRDRRRRCRRRAILALALAMVVASPGVALAGTKVYKGKNFDATTGKSAGKYKITVEKKKTKDGEKFLKVKVVCTSKKKKCRVIKNEQFRMSRGESRNEYSGSFRLFKSKCEIGGIVYSGGFETTFNCRNGYFGSISGRRGGEKEG